MTGEDVPDAYNAHVALKMSIARSYPGMRRRGIKIGMDGKKRYRDHILAERLRSR